MLGPRSLKRVEQSNVTADSRTRKAKLDTLKLPYSDDTDEDVSPTDESGDGIDVSDVVAEEEHVQEEPEASEGLTRTLPGRKSQGSTHAPSLGTASTTSTSLPEKADDEVVDADAQHSEHLETADAVKATDLVEWEVPPQQEALASSVQKAVPSKGTRTRSASQNAPRRKSVHSEGVAKVDQQPGPASTDTQASPQRLTRSGAQREANGNASTSPGRPLTRSQGSDKRKSPAKVAERFKARQRDQHNALSSSVRQTSSLHPSRGTQNAGTSTAPAPVSSLARSPNRTLTESQLQHIAHPTAKPTYNDKLPSVEQSQPEGGPQAEAAAVLQSGREDPTSKCENATAQDFVTSVGAKIEQLRLWLRFRSQLVRVVADAVVDAMRVQKEGDVYRHHGAPVLLMCSDATSAAQFARTIRCGCVQRDGEFLALCDKGAGRCRTRNLQEEQAAQNSMYHVLPVVMLQACEVGHPQAGDMVVENVTECAAQDGVAEVYEVRWVSCDDGRENLLWDSSNVGQQLIRFIGKRSRHVGGQHEERTAAAGERGSLSPEKKRARSDLEAIFQRYPNLSELKKPEHAAHLEEMCTMWYGSPAMREYGQMAWFVLAYFVTGYPIEAFRFEKPLAEYDEFREN